MGMLYDGQWVDRPFVQSADGGRFQRTESQFRGFIAGTRDAPGGGEWPVDGDRYRLYVAWACPWAHRTLLARALYGLEEVLPVAVVAPEMLDDGWVFDATHPDRFEGHQLLRELYLQAEPRCTSRVTVPVLWDQQTHTIVSNESAEIIRMLSGPLATLGRADAPLRGHDLRPSALAAELDEVNDRVYHHVSNGVYKSGFAGTQAAYDDAVGALFDSLDWLEERLTHHRWLVGNVFTEADLRLFPTMLRFDAVYHGHFKCNRAMLRDFPALSAWTRDVAALPGVSTTHNLAETRRHYYYSHRSVNPRGIVPIGPQVDFSAPAGRDHLGPSPLAQR